MNYKGRSSIVGLPFILDRLLSLLRYFSLLHVSLFFPSYLVQRVPRYTLLLEDILNNTSSLHREYPSLSGALIHMQRMQEFVNDSCNEDDRSSTVSGSSVRSGGNSAGGGGKEKREREKEKEKEKQKEPLNELQNKEKKPRKTHMR